MAYNFTQVLPVEIVERILKLLNARDLARFQSVCNRWRKFGNADNLWLHFCMKKGWLKYGLNNNLLNEESLYPARTNVSGNSPLFDLCVSKDSRLSTICKWKHIFLRLGHLKTNWRKGRYTVGPIMRGHMDKVNAFDCLGNCLISGSEDKTLRIWDLSTCECKRRIGGHSDGITAVKIIQNQVITGCGDGVIRIIDIASGKLVLTFIGHGGSVDHIQVVGSLIVSAGTDRTIRVWSMTSKELLFIMRMHTDEVECLSVFGKHAVSGSWDKTLVLWDLDTGRCIHKLEGHCEVVSCVQFDSYKVVSGSADGSVLIWSCKSGECLHKLEGHKEEVYCLVYNDEVIASGSADSIIILWSLHGHNAVDAASSSGNDDVTPFLLDMDNQAESYNNTLDTNACDVEDCGTEAGVLQEDVHHSDFNRPPSMEHLDSVDTEVSTISQGQLLHTMREHLGVVRCLHINNERLVSGGDQSVVNVWDYRSGTKTSTLHRHPTKLHLMWVGDTKLITASPEKSGTLTVLSFW